MAKNEATEVDTAEAGDAPLIDLNDASIKKMIARAKKRGIVTYEELNELSESPDHLLLVASLTDKLGSYGKIGLALVEKGEKVWQLRMMLMSCRVMSRGVGMVLLNHIMTLAKEAGVALHADFVETGRNRMMQITYAFAGFREVSRDGSLVVLGADLDALQPPPPYVDIEIL